MKKILWLIAIILIIVQIALLHLFIFKSQLPDDMAFIVKNSLQTIVSIAYLPLAFSLLLSAFPFKDWNFKNKWSWCFPILLIISGLYALGKSGAEVDKIQSSGGKYISKGEFEAIQPSIKLNCDKLKQGTFETKEMTHIREEKREIQLIKSTNQHYEFGIHWINDCEFFLRAYYQGSESQSVKITGVGQNSYDCVVLKGNIAERFKVKIQNESMD